MSVSSFIDKYFELKTRFPSKTRKITPNMESTL